jgi:hypothetical protein
MAQRVRGRGLQLIAHRRFLPSFQAAAKLQRSSASAAHLATVRTAEASRRRTPDFTDKAWLQSRNDKAFLDAITNGTDKGMPAFASQLTTQQIDLLARCVVRVFAAAQQGR